MRSFVDFISIPLEIVVALVILTIYMPSIASFIFNLFGV